MLLTEKHMFLNAGLGLLIIFNVNKIFQKYNFTKREFFNLYLIHVGI
jgi:hypothetical protein